MSSTWEDLMEVPSLNNSFQEDDSILLEDSFIGAKDPVLLNPPGAVFVEPYEETTFHAGTGSQRQSEFDGFSFANGGGGDSTFHFDTYSSHRNSISSSLDTFNSSQNKHWYEETQNLNLLDQLLAEEPAVRSSVDEFLTLNESQGQAENLVEKTTDDILQEIILEANELEEMSAKRTSPSEEYVDSGDDTSTEGTDTPTTFAQSPSGADLASTDMESEDSFVESFIDSRPILSIPADKLPAGLLRGDEFVFDLKGLSPMILQDTDGNYHRILGSLGKAATAAAQIRQNPGPKRVGRWRASGRQGDAKERKRQQNREAAARYRVKKQKEKHLFVDALSQEEARNRELKAQLGDLNHEIAYLKSLMSEVRNRKREMTK